MSEIQSHVAEGARRRPRISSPPLLDVVFLAGLLTLGVIVPFVVGLVAGSQGIPRNDDWVYRRIALDLASSGVLSLHSVTTMLVGQIVLVQPFLSVFGLSSSAFSAFGAVSAIGAVLASYGLARQFLSPPRAALATSLLLVFPGYLAYATSFMTDVPTLALEMTCLGFGVVALRHRPVRIRWLLASAVVGCLAFSIREFAIAAPTSVLLAAICAEPRRFKTWALAIGAACGCGLLVLLKSALPGQQLGGAIGYAQIDISLYQLGDSLASVSLPLLPAAIIAAAWWRQRWKRADVAIGVELGLVVIGFELFQWYHDRTIPLVTLGNLANQRGIAGSAVLLGNRPLLFGDVSWLVVSGAALIATFLALAIGAGVVGSLLRRHNRSMRALVKALGSPAGVLVLFASLLGLGLTIFGFHWPVFDRYYWPLIPPASILLLSPRAEGAFRRSRRLLVPVGASLLGLTFISVIFMLNSFAFDSARWRAGEDLAQLGVKPDEVDAGYEWVGAHAPTLPKSITLGTGLTVWEAYFPGYRACGAVSSDVVGPPGFELVGSESYSLDLIAGPTERLYLYRATSPACTTE